MGNSDVEMEGNDEGSDAVKEEEEEEEESADEYVYESSSG
jgi:hypothetical protein